MSSGLCGFVNKNAIDVILSVKSAEYKAFSQHFVDKLGHDKLSGVFFNTANKVISDSGNEEGLRQVQEEFLQKIKDMFGERKIEFNDKVIEYKAKKVIEAMKEAASRLHVSKDNGASSSVVGVETAISEKKRRQLGV